PFKAVPAVEFFENEERQGVLDNIISLNDALEKLLSQKSNQNEYFDNSYLKILGVQLPEKVDEKGNPISGTVDLDILNNNVIYSPDTDATKGVIDFITKPDNDQMQEHEIDRLTGLIYKISMVANMDDE
ncbi:phage portal protein, partial [Lentilactobacillus kefiri]|uniref:phage portal protein n=1 Tax=Lentilactobacillus kefiri TaxID=33962 RepID=UPI000BCCF586